MVGRPASRFKDDEYVSDGDGRIETVGELSDPPTLMLRGCAVLPGFVNAHSHVDLTHLRGEVPFEGEFAKWIERIIEGRKRPGMRAAALWGVKEAIARGTTAFCDIVTPDGFTTLQSFTITTANDADGRDPTAWTLFGTNDVITSMDNSAGNAENWTMIDSGSVALPETRLTLGPVVNVSNTNAYSSYQMLYISSDSNPGFGFYLYSVFCHCINC